MVFTGYLDVGGREIINAGRTQKYVEMLLPTLKLEGCGDCEGLHEALGHPAYSSPVVDRPEWLDPDNPDTWDFYGLYPVTFEGFEDATTTAAVTEFIYDGGAVSPPRRASRSVRVTGLMIGLSPEAVSAGMTWLRKVLRPGGCAGNASCTGDHMSYFIACPPLCTDAPDLLADLSEPRECATGAILTPISRCARPYERHLYDSVCIDGPRIVNTYDPKCGAMVMVEFTIVSGVPSPFGTAQQVIDVDVEQSDLVSIPDYTCDPSSEGALVQRTQAARNPLPQLWDLGWETLDPAYWNNNANTTVVHTPGGRSVYSNRWTEGGWGPAVLGGVAFAGADGNQPANTPQVASGITYTVSAWMLPDVTARGYIEVQPTNETGVNIGPSIFAASDLAPAMTWVRGVVTFTVPQGATRLRISARMEVPFPGVALFGDGAYFTEVLVEAAAGASIYFDGDTLSSDPTVTFSWFGTPGHSASRMVQQVYAGPIVDPDCPPVPSPPRPPTIDESCVVDVGDYKRFTVTIPADVVPRWSDIVPIVNLTTSTTPIRQLRVRFYSNPSGLPIYDLVQCDFVGEFIVSYLPPNSTMTIDGTSQEVVVTGKSGLSQTGSHLLYGSGGGPMVWPFMSCGSQYDLAIDLDPDATGLEFELCVAARE